MEEEGELALLFQSRDIETFKPNTEDFETKDDDLPVVIGLPVSVATSGLVEPVDLADAEERVRAAVEHVGIETYGTFGLHLVRHLSY